MKINVVWHHIVERSGLTHGFVQKSRNRARALCTAIDSGVEWPIATPVETAPRCVRCGSVLRKLEAPSAKEGA